MKNFLFLFLITIFYHSSNAQNSEIRNPSNFSSIKFTISGTMHLYQGNTFKVEILGDQEVIDNIATETKKDVLTIERRDNGGLFRSVNKSDDYIINITLPKLKSIDLYKKSQVIGKSTFKGGDLEVEMNGSATFEMNMKMDDVEVDAEKSASITLSGNVEELEVRLDDKATLNAENLAAEDCDISLKGSGDALINVSDKLRVNIKKSGNVYYRGGVRNVKISTSGKGIVTKL